MKLRTLLSKHDSNIALLVGNGVNLFGSSDKNSWGSLLAQLAREHLNSRHEKVPKGISHTEFYDVLELAHARKQGSPKLVAQFCELMASWKPMEQHKAIAGWAAHHGVPILTTNFENTLGEAVGCTFRRTRNKGFTDFYPWETYYSLADVIEPCSQFAIWHINGMQKYPRSIKLGLTQYMGSAARARGWLHNGAGRLLSDPAGTAWKGAATWLQVFFHKPILVVGQGLPETEIFLRWLMIERAKYFRRYPDLRKPAWYVHIKDDLPVGKELFLRAVGFEPFPVSSYDEMYEYQTWNGK